MIKFEKISTLSSVRNDNNSKSSRLQRFYLLLTYHEATHLSHLSFPPSPPIIIPLPPPPSLDHCIININKDIGANAQEFQILHHLQRSSIAQENASHPGRHAVVQLRDSLDLSVSHRCLVLDVLGMEVQARADRHSQKNKGSRLPRETALRVAR